MARPRRKISLVAVVAAACLSVTMLTGIAASAASASPTSAATSSRTVLAGSAVPFVIRHKPVGTVAKSSRVSFELVLQLRDAAGAKALVAAVSTPGASGFHQYLTAAQWEARFSPTARQVASAVRWLKSEHFRVGAVSKDRITVSASGTAAQVEKAFGTHLAYYRVAGHVERDATTALSVPSTLAGSVVGAMGINQNVATPAVAGGARPTSVAPSTSKFPPAPSAFITAKPCGSYYGAKVKTVTPAFGHGYATKVPIETCGYTPGQFRSGYGLSSSDTGRGVTVAIIDAYGSATIGQDATRYFATEDPSIPFNDSPPSFAQDDAFPFDDESLCAASSWLVEQDLDVEAVHSMAPDANILYVGAQDCINGLFNAEQSVIDGSLANVVTNSWGDTGGDLLDDVSTRTAYDDLFMMADSTGITVQFSTGDDGDNFNLLGASAADYPASSPYVTAVGGTTLEIGSNGQQTGQLGWATGRSFLCTSNVENALPGCTSSTVNTWMPVSYDGGSGGFTSYDYTQPSYQAPVVPSTLSYRNENIIGAVAMRVIPDISMDADPSTGLLMGLHEQFPNGKTHYGLTRYGGTSLASPLLAGVVADSDQAAMAAGGSPLGFINPAIYRLDKVAGAIDDIVSGGKQADYRFDHAFTYIGGATGEIQSFREITYTGRIVYCDETGNCASRPNTLTTAAGYDSMTGLGSIGTSFISDMSNF